MLAGTHATRIQPTLMLRGVALFAIAVWIGGLTFYGGVVVPSATEVLGSHRAAGFITRVVTNWMNWIGAASLVVLLVHARTVMRIAGNVDRLLWRSWLALLLPQLAMFGLHPILDGYLDPASRHVDEPDTFYWLHRGYLWLAAVLWIAGVLHAAAMLRAWSRIDRLGAEVPA